jgi:hypothetical protein
MRKKKEEDEKEEGRRATNASFAASSVIHLWPVPMAP